MAVKLKGQGSLCPQQVVSAREREHLEWAFIAEAALLVQTILVWCELPSCSHSWQLQRARARGHVNCWPAAGLS